MDLNSILLPSHSQLTAPTHSDTMSVQFGHTLLPSKVRPGKGIGLYGQGDEHPRQAQSGQLVVRGWPHGGRPVRQPPV